MPIFESFSFASIVVPAMSAVTSMPAMEHVQKRTQNQQSVREKLHDMRPMFCPEEIRRDG
jgi:hypothetical protein